MSGLAGGGGRGGAVNLLRCALVGAGLLGSGPGWGVQPDEMLSDPVLEGRARHISAELRCLVCQNQSIDDSDAPLARDLRILVRERLKVGDSDAATLDYLVRRYGEFVLLRPRFGPSTLVLWVAPFAIAAAALASLLLTGRARGAAAGPVALSAEESEQLRRLGESGPT